MKDPSALLRGLRQRIGAPDAEPRHYAIAIVKKASGRASTAASNGRNREPVATRANRSAKKPLALRNATRQASDRRMADRQMIGAPRTRLFPAARAKRP